MNNRIFQNHIRRVVGLENTEAKVLINHYREALKHIKAQLLMAQDNTFTEAKLEAIKLQLEHGIAAVEQRIKSDMQESFAFMTEQGIEDSVKEINYLEKEFQGVHQLVPVDAILASVKPNNYLFNSFESSIQSYNESLRSGMQNAMTQGLIQRKTLSQIVNDIENTYKMSEWRVHRIVRTELHQIYNVSKIDSLTSIKKQFIPSLKKRLVHPIDDRTAQDSKELAKKNPIIDIDKNFVQYYNGKRIEFMNPPNRPNDRAILIPFRDIYDNDNDTNKGKNNV